jgi:iron(III) transport system permease protein
LCLAVGWVGYAALPWYSVGRDGIFALGWLATFPDATTAPALLQALAFGRPWLLPIGIALALPLLTLGLPREHPAFGRLLAIGGALGLVLTGLAGFGIVNNGPRWGWVAALLGDVRQPGLGAGAVLTVSAFVMLLANGIAARGNFRGDAFIAGALTVIIALIALFVAFPVAGVLLSAVQDADGNFAPQRFLARITASDVWGLGCITGGVSCGVAWNTVFLGVLASALSTALGLAFALIATRTGFRWKRALRVLTILPIITPPFVISLALIILFGRTGIVTAWLGAVFDIPRSRWLYGLPGVLIAQVLSFTPVAFMVLIGVVEGISPSLEEASQTLGAKAAKTFSTVTWPLMRPGIASALLLGFVESLADFGNPLVLGGNYEVLSTQIYFAIVGAAYDPGRAAMLAVVLLFFTLGAFWVQNRWLGETSYVTVTGKGDAGLTAPLPRGLRRLCYATAIPWALFTITIYAIILVGGFVRDMGRGDLTFTWRHYLTAFQVEQAPQGLFFSGSAWPSLTTTLEVAAVAAPLTAAIGLLTAWLLARQRFAGRRAFEFATMMSFAIPGTVIGVSYIVAFNVPPIEITGTGLILVICFVFRNMPVGTRAGLAALAQIDKSLDEASLTLGGRSATTLFRVVLPLLRPAIVATLVFSFVHAMTAVSAIIFLVSARYNMATAYIGNRVEAGEYALAIAYSTVLIVVMLLAIVLIQLAVGQRKLGRRVPAVSLGAA